MFLSTSDGSVNRVQAEHDEGAEMPYEVPPLPYDYAALEPHIDEATMRVHHDKHHQAYVDKANAALEGTEWADKPIEEVVANLNDVPEDKRKPVRNNGGGDYNHPLFGERVGPARRRGANRPALGAG